MSYKSVKGMNDLIPPASSAWAKIESKARSLFESFGFSEISTPVVERTELFSRSAGKTSDIVEKQMYVFEDKKGESLCLRPEGTAPVARSYIEHQMYHPEPYKKLYYWGPMYRYERMQKGRYRQHTQIGAEVFGALSPRIDAETIYMLTEFYRQIGLDQFDVQINSIGCLTCRPKYRKQVLSYFNSHVESLCEDCNRRLETNPLRMFDCKNEGCKTICKEAPKITQHLCVDCKNHFDHVQSGLRQLNVSFEVNPSIVRGLDYYVRTAFEINSTALGANDTIGAGGRYDGLVKALGGPDVPGFGFASGVERILLLLEGKLASTAYLDLYVAALGAKAQAFSYGLVNKLRLQGIKTELDYEDRPLKAQMKKADRMNTKYVLIIGEDELSQGKGVLRDMKTKKQESIPFGDLLLHLQRKIKS